ncbi:MAG: phosphoglycolate phosphatase [Desulfovibrio sp. MES5]|uniref:HAD-IA family hydrolase n=1 Tax=Desulfovibrio sp. MES5 TaxID=1899016 RepID=UPI000B9CDCC1|nr:HAD-IA family hydrolase [Desulfovibrio sp. MES5]OXS28542.1 MAG: phosphoglycolate phosphatase [Desulfovibrio sp. MES5]
MRFNPIFFDLDGTITDSAQGIIRAVQYALEYFNISATEESLIPFIGPPLRDSFAHFFPGDTEKLEQVVAKYREYYVEQGIFQSRLYDGIADLLRQLAENGHTLALATSKPEPFAVRIIEHFNLTRYFACIAGAQFKGERTDKPAVLRYACQTLGVTPSAGCLMVGDRKYDVLGAHEVGMPCAAVLYGYGSEEELKKAGADQICPDVKGLRKFLIGA